jgi:hypothetical protein
VAVCIPLNVQIGKRWKKFRLQAEKLKEVKMRKAPDNKLELPKHLPPPTTTKVEALKNNSTFTNLWNMVNSVVLWRILHANV